MRRKQKALVVCCAASAAASALLTAHSVRAAAVVDFEATTFTTGSNWTSSAQLSGGSYLVATAAGSNTLNTTVNGSVDPLVDVTTGNGFTVPAATTTPPGGLTSYTIAALFYPTTSKVTGGFVYQAASLYGYDIAGAAMPDTGLGFGGVSGDSVIAGLGAVSGDQTITSRAVATSQLHAAVFQVNDPGGAANQGTATLWVDGNFIGEITGLTVQPMNPSAAAGNFGLGGQFAGGTFPGLIGAIQVYPDALENGASLSNTLSTNYGGSPAGEISFNFTNSSSGAYGNKVNWGSNATPTNSNFLDDARISNGGTAIVNASTGTVYYTLNLFVGDFGSGTGVGNVNQTSGTLAIGNSFYLGRNNGSGTYNLSGGILEFGIASGTDAGAAPQSFELVGNTSTPAIMNIFGTGLLSVANNSGGVLIGEGTINASGGAIAASAILNISGTGSLNTANSVIYVGDNTNGSLGVLNISSGTVYPGNTLAIGHSGGTGIVNLSGTGTITKNNASAGTVNIGGANGIGILNETAGSFVNANTNTNIGELGGNGTWNLSGGTAANMSTLNVGDNGVGVLNLSGTATLSATTTNIGNGQFSNGTLNLTATTPTLPTVNIGGSGTGLLNVTGTGVFNATTVTVGVNALGNGMWNQSVGSSAVPTVTIGSNGTGTVNLNTSAGLTATTVTLAANATGTGTLNLSGGTLTTASLTRGTGVTGTVNFNGGTLVASNNSSTFVSGFKPGELVLQSGGGKINTQAFNVTLASGLSGTGGLTKLGAGTLVIGQQSSDTYTGTTTIQAGTVQVQRTVYNNNLLATGVAAYYPFNNSGSLLNDASPNGNNLVDAFSEANYNTSAPAGLTGSVSLPVGNSTSGHDYLTTPSQTTPSNFPLNNSSYTLAAWINLDGTNIGSNGIIGWGTYGTARSTIAFRTGNSAIGTNTMSPNQLDNYWWNADQVDTIPNSQGSGSLVGNWNYVAVTYNATTDVRTIYDNGVVIGTDSPGANNASNTNFAIGSTNNNPYEYFSGSISDMLITTSALTPAQLTQASNANISFGTYIYQGTLASGPMAIATGATLDLNGSTQTIGTLQNFNGAGGLVTNSGATVASLTLAPPVGSSTFAGNIQDGSGTIALTISGVGTQVLTGISNYSGGTTIIGGTLEIASTGSLLASGAINASGGSLLYDANTGAGILQRSAGAVTVGPFGTVTVAVSSTHANRTYLTVSGLSIAPTGKLDLGNGDMDIQGGGASLGVISALVQAGYNGGTWNGTGGIASAAAASNTAHLTALGVINNDNGSGTPLYGSGGMIATSFDGTTPADGDALIKYTYYGDSNLDGKVDGTDYGRLDNGYLNSLTGWYNGDFNYDGVINGSDYTLIDNAFNSQGASLASAVANPTAEIASPSTASAVPEPASLALIAIAAPALLGRRRRRSHS